jgi:hypothetical protein
MSGWLDNIKSLFDGVDDEFHWQRGVYYGWRCSKCGLEEISDTPPRWATEGACYGFRVFTHHRHVPLVSEQTGLDYGEFKFCGYVERVRA